MKTFAAARALEKLELDLLRAMRAIHPGTERAFPVSLGQWGDHPLEIHGVYATQQGHFIFVALDGPGAEPMVRRLGTEQALGLVRILGDMGITGNRTRLDELVHHAC